MNEIPTSEKRCPRCGACMDLGLPEGLCAACLWGDLLRDENEEKAQSQLIHIAGHEVLEEIGHGGMGVVYRARQEQPPRDVALKIVSPYSLRLGEARKRFLMEAEAMAAIEHAGVLPLYQAGEDEFGRPWLTMMLARGGALTERFAEYHTNYRKAVELMLLLCDAVAHAHERGLLHRDLKPANILFDEEGHPYVADFGLAKWADAEGGITQTSYLLGSPAYLAPETAELGSKACTTLSDVYGLGAVFYELLTSKQPYEGSSAGEILTQIVTQDPASPRLLTQDLPRDLEVIVKKSMAREPLRRYQSARELAQDLQRWMEGVAILARPLSSLERLWYWAKRNPSLAVVSALLIMIVSTSAWLLWQANRKLEVALRDAEQRVDFMVHKLPEKLEPLGRLDILDDVFADVETHYARSANDDPVALARRADFHAEWSQILRPRGLTDQSLAQLRAAYAFANRACAREGNDTTLPVVVARIHAGWRLGEVLMESRDFAEAERILLDAKQFLSAQKPRHGAAYRLRHLEALIELEMLIMFTKSGRTGEGLAIKENVERLWNDLIKDFAAEPLLRSRELTEAARVPFFLNMLHMDAGDKQARVKDLDDYVAKTDALLQIAADNPLFVGENFSAQLARARYDVEEVSGELGTNPEELIAADERMLALIAQDPGNRKWMMQAIHLARVMVLIFENRQEPRSANEWMAKMNARLLPAYDLTLTNKEALVALRFVSMFCLDRASLYEPEIAMRHEQGLRKVQIQICEQFPENKEFVNLFHQWHRLANRPLKGEAIPFEQVRGYAEFLQEKSQSPSLTRLDAQRWSMMSAMVWHHLAEANSADARANATRLFLGSLDAIAELIAYEEKRVSEVDQSIPLVKNEVVVRVNNRLRLIEGLLFSAESADVRLLSILENALSALDEESRRIITPTMDRCFADTQGNYRAPYDSLKKFRLP